MHFKVSQTCVWLPLVCLHDSGCRQLSCNLFLVGCICYSSFCELSEDGQSIDMSLAKGACFHSALVGYI